MCSPGCSRHAGSPLPDEKRDGRGPAARGASSAGAAAAGAAAQGQGSDVSRASSAGAVVSRGGGSRGGGSIGAGSIGYHSVVSLATSDAAVASLSPVQVTRLLPVTDAAGDYAVEEDHQNDRISFEDLTADREKARTDK
ncbi:sodium channel protein para-like [Macrobrachium nipponense]|uniref:sodium channel protein para-like n=1 Tax=Macrobrachium nipponense TaxID=159736 RepID=UPI0030C8783D